MTRCQICAAHLKITNWTLTKNHLKHCKIIGLKPVLNLVLDDLCHFLRNMNQLAHEPDEFDLSIRKNFKLSCRNGCTTISCFNNKT